MYCEGKAYGWQSNEVNCVDDCRVGGECMGCYPKALLEKQPLAYQQAYMQYHNWVANNWPGQGHELTVNQRIAIATELAKVDSVDGGAILELLDANFTPNYDYDGYNVKTFCPTCPSNCFGECTNKQAVCYKCYSSCERFNR